jgi:thiol-disulfide isomerase/thioredoxin
MTSANSDLEKKADYNSLPQKTLIQKAQPWLLQLGFFIVFFIAINWWQTKDMLENNSQLKQTQLNIVDILGESFKFEFNHQSKPTLIYFFAPWCGICHLSIDNLEAIYQKNASDLNVLVIALGWQSKQEIDDFIQEHKLSMPILFGTNTIQQSFKIHAFPSYYLIDEDAKVIAKDSGYSTALGLNWRVAINS